MRYEIHYTILLHIARQYMKVKVNQYMINFNTAVGLNIILSCFCCILFNVPFVPENIHQLWYVTNVRKFLKVKRRRIYIENHIHSRADSLTQRGKIMFVKIVILSSSPFIQWRCMLESVTATILNVDFVMLSLRILISLNFI